MNNVEDLLNEIELLSKDKKKELITKVLRDNKKIFFKILEEGINSKRYTRYCNGYHNYTYGKYNETCRNCRKNFCIKCINIEYEHKNYCSNTCRNEFRGYC